MSSLKDSEFFYFRSEFDKTLKLFFRENPDVDAIPGGFNVSISSISCLILLTEREKERREFHDNPPEQYTKDTFFEDIEDIGIGVDDFLLKTFKGLIDEGFIKDTGKEIFPSDRGVKVIDWLDFIFPGMPGISFLAYIVQTLDEVYTDRKSLAQGKEVFYQTLKSRSSRKGGDKAHKSMKVETEEREKVAINTEMLRQRLQEIRNNRSKNRQNYFLRHAEVKSVFHRFDKEEQKDISEKVSPLVEEKEDISTENQADIDFKELEDGPDSESLIEPLEEDHQKDAGCLDDAPNLSSVVAEESVPAEAAKTALPDEEEETVQIEEPHEEKIPVEPVQSDVRDLAVSNKTEPEQEISPAPKEVLTEDEIAARISEFEDQLAIGCPVCGKGKVIEGQTEKGKTFYQCNNNLCHFISWSKPFHFECPLCKNPFLVEVVLPGGLKGLQCPRATCDYVQEDQIDPVKKAPKKKKRLVRRVRRKK